MKKTVKDKKVDLQVEIQKGICVPEGSLSQILSKRKDIMANDLKPKIAVLGVGGGGGNAINNLIRSGLKDVVTISCNTDAQSLTHSLADIKIQLGPNLTKGLGAGANADVGKIAAQESEKEIKKHLDGVHMAFIVAGLGGGTGTGAGPEICKMVIDHGILTIGFVTTPFEFEGAQRKKSAAGGLEEFQNNCDVLVVVGNQNLFSLTNEETTFLNAFALTDEVLCSGVHSVIQTITTSGLINTDLSDFCTILRGRKSRARMGCGIAEGEDRGLHAAQEAMASPLLELGGMMAKDIDGVIICIRCGEDMTLNDIHQAVDYIKQSVDENANIIFGATIDKEMRNKVQVSVFATSSVNLQNHEIAEEKYYSEENHLDQVNLNIQSFEELITDDVQLGRPHAAMLHEDDKNNIDNFVVGKKKKGVIRRVWDYFFGKKDDNIPNYLK